MVAASSSPVPSRHVLVVGNDDGTNVGASLVRAARSLGLAVTLVDARKAWEGPTFLRRVNWWLRGRRPTRMGRFSQHVVDLGHTIRPTWVLTTGMVALDAAAVAMLREQGASVVNFSTDDPWNPAFRAAWFLDSLPHYTRIYTPRRANLDDFRRRGCEQVSYLPFGVDHDVFHPVPLAPEEREAWQTDVTFAGGADAERVPYMAALAAAGLKVRLYGDYWERFDATRPLAAGHANPDTLRRSIAGASLSLCLPRHANRDGHCMRSFEVPAVGGCMLAEDTQEHREIFGPDRETVAYFSSRDDLVRVAKELLDRPAERQRLAAAAHHRVSQPGHSYRDRLRVMLAPEAPELSGGAR